MKQTKHIWWTFSPWEADALRQYLEQLALEAGIRNALAQPA